MSKYTVQFLVCNYVDRVIDAKDLEEVEHIGNSNEKTVKAIRGLCKAIKDTNNQECILLTQEPIHSEFI